MTDFPRLEVNLSQDVADGLREYMARKHITATEVTGRAFSALLSIDKYYQQHAALYLEQDGKWSEVLFNV